MLCGEVSSCSEWQVAGCWQRVKLPHPPIPPFVLFCCSSCHWMSGGIGKGDIHSWLLVLSLVQCGGPVGCLVVTKCWAQGIAPVTHPTFLGIINTARDPHVIIHVFWLRGRVQVMSPLWALGMKLPPPFDHAMGSTLFPILVDLPVN